LSSDALKLSASQLRRLPLPAPGPDWDAAAAAVRIGDLRGAALASCRAYGVEPEPLVDWWSRRLPYRGPRD
jgi:hypothetical protein